ncbi:MAG: hypothetical protein IIT40_10410 [Prevotella sp.]|nr:hypothetical protein [Prevotella sp.]
MVALDIVDDLYDGKITFWVEQVGVVPAADLDTILAADEAARVFVKEHF